MRAVVELAYDSGRRAFRLSPDIHCLARSRRLLPRAIAGVDMNLQESLCIPNVRALAEGIDLVCEVKGRRVRIARNAIAPESHVRKAGDYGALVISRELAQQLRLSAE
jgi:hypothetical protein